MTVNCSSQSRCHHLFEAFYGGAEPKLSLLNVGSTIRTFLGDSFTRERMQDELVRLWGEAAKTVVFVTHDLAEAIALADRVVVFSGRPGRIKSVHRIDIERPRDVFRIRFDARFQALHETIWQELAPEIRKGEAL